MDFFGNLNTLTPQLLSLILTTIIICTFCIVFNVKIRNLKDDDELSGFLILSATLITSFENMVVSVMGKRFKHLTPYIMYIFMYIFISSLLALLGFEAHTTSLTVTFSMAIVTFLAIYYYGFRYQKFLYFQRYMYNPLDIFTQFAPILSLSFRLFGNTIAGSIILGLLYSLFINVQGIIFGFDNVANEIWNNNGGVQYWWTGLNLMSAAIVPWLHLYFDLFDGFIQALVFSMLTLSYWANAKSGEHERSQEPVERHNTKKLRIRKLKIRKFKVNNQEKIIIEGGD